MNTRIVKVNPEKPNEKTLREAGGVLRGGGLVIFPTETVYGIGCRVEKEALEKLDIVKNRQVGKYYTVHIGQKEDLGKYVPAICAKARKLVENAWPGPVTIVFDLDEAGIEEQRKKLDVDVFANLYKDNSVGLRCPDNIVASKLLRYANCAIVAPSANLGGERAANDAEEAISVFDGKVDMILDAGACREKLNSTVVKINPRGCKILRKGAYPAEKIKRDCELKIVFICTGNTCRSPVAEGLCKKYLAEKLSCNLDELADLGYKISSAGLMTIADLPVSENSIAFLSGMGIDIRDKRSKNVTDELIEDSDFIFVMSQSHRKHIASLWPRAAEKCRLLLEGRDVFDPVGSSQQVYNECSSLIEEGVIKRISECLI